MEKQLKGMVNEMLDYFECPYFSNSFIELWNHRFEEYMQLVKLGFERSNYEGEIHLPKIITLIFKLNRENELKLGDILKIIKPVEEQKVVEIQADEVVPPP